MRSTTAGTRSSATRGRTLAEVRDAAGHSNVVVTGAYLHVGVEDAERAGTLFAEFDSN